MGHSANVTNKLKYSVSKSEKNATILSRLFFWFVIPIIRQNRQKTLDPSELNGDLGEHESCAATKKLQLLWTDEKACANRENRKSSFLRTIFRFIWKRLFVIGIFTFIGELLVLVQPICMGRLIRYFRFNTTLTDKDAYIAAGCITIINFVLVGLRSQYFWALQKLGMRTKIATSGIIVEKSVAIGSRSNFSIGHVINLLSTDVQTFDTVFLFTNYFWISPILLILYSNVVWSEVGTAAFAGFGALVVLSSIQAYFSHKSGKCRKRIAERTDERISVMNEVLNGIRLIKMYAWEEAFSKDVGQLRRKELIEYRWNALYQSIVSGIFASGSKLVILPIAICYGLMGNEVTTEKIFVTENTSPSFAIKNVTLNARRGQLIGIVGPVGCGKSSLLASILRETSRIDGNLTIKGTIAYCSQEAWIFGGTIRENILFGRGMNRALYAKALEYSSLLSDLDQIPFGDKAIVGDRGTSLSGGQRARVALARAIYSDADIYLLDDPLSAVDVKVGREIFENCISKFLRNGIVILVTHQLQFLEQFDQIFLMKGGEVVASGSPKKLKESHAEVFDELLQETERSYNEVPEKPSQYEHSEKEQSTAEPVEPGSEEESSSAEEDRAVGDVPLSVYWRYITAMCSSSLFIPPAILTILCVQFLFNFTDYWLSKWTTAAEQHAMLSRNSSFSSDVEYTMNTTLFSTITVSLNLDQFQNVFTILTVVLVLMIIVRCFCFKVSQTVASEVIHKRMFDSVVNTHSQFFDTNPLGRILNRFSKDVYVLDEPLAFTFYDFTMTALTTMGFVTVIVFVNPFILLFTVPLAALVFWLRRIFLTTSQDVKRLEAVSRSPLYSHISEVLNGVVTVRAFQKAQQVIQIYHHHMNLNSSAFFLDISITRWFTTCLDWTVSVFVAFVTFAAIFSPAVFTSGEVALMLLYAIEISVLFSWLLERSANLQNHMVSLERIVHYCQLSSEHKNTSTTNIIPIDWPNYGNITIEKLTLKYKPEGPSVLNNMSLSVKSGEKIGIVGRTGAGKSSLLRAIFRLTPPFSGRILIDGVDISTISLKTLRRSLAIIPQEPVLFVGTVRYNIDPFEEHSDEQLWDALSQVKLKEAISQLSGGLDASMQEGGSNFSVGQRQLVCLARAILRKAKIVVIDEATANVDQHTDNLVQATIRGRFRDSTVLTIAHRLNTIMDSDRILVMGEGAVMEFDSPHNLLMNGQSVFSSLVKENGEEQKNTLSGNSI